MVPSPSAYTEMWSLSEAHCPARNRTADFAPTV
jgi:hypothetical protein